MIRLDSKSLPVEVLSQLAGLQHKIDVESTFKAKVEKAQQLWNSKGGTEGKKAFKQIVEYLYDMCVYVGVCNYCEQSEANDVEHIYPKSFFPEQTFTWDNYLLACKQCNSAYKIDICFVLDDQDNVIELQRGQQPAFKNFAFINPRTEDPNCFMILNTFTFTFELLPALSKLDENKALKTLDVLQLNVRDTLLAARKSAAHYYYLRMKLLVDILNAATTDHIRDLLTPHDDLLDPQLSLAELKQTLKISFQQHICTYQHPSVWHSIKVIASKTNQKWKTIFDQIPEALQW
jgi:uncharacterized protein (TIGR02646 family)